MMLSLPKPRPKDRTEYSVKARTSIFQTDLTDDMIEILERYPIRMFDLSICDKINKAFQGGMKPAKRNPLDQLANLVNPWRSSNPGDH